MAGGLNEAVFRTYSLEVFPILDFCPVLRHVLEQVPFVTLSEKMHYLFSYS